MQQELHILEEETNLFWGIIILVCTAGGTYLLAGTFMSMNWNILNFRQFMAVLLFLVSFWAIFRISEPLYHFIFRFKGDILVIDIYKGSLHFDSHRIAADHIEALKFAPDTPRSRKEALFDFSRTYQLMWKKKNDTRFQKMLFIESSRFTLKVNDIAKIMRFIRDRVPGVRIPPEQESYFNL